MDAPRKSDNRLAKYTRKREVAGILRAVVVVVVRDSIRFRSYILPLREFNRNFQNLIKSQRRLWRIWRGTTTMRVEPS